MQGSAAASAAASTAAKGSRARIAEVDAEHAGRRLDNFLLGQLNGVPKTLIYRICRRGEVRVNKGRVKPDYRVQAGDQVRIPPIREAAERAPASPRQADLQRIGESLVFENADFLVINKPSGMAVHGGSGQSYGVIEALRALRPEARFLELVHRLDRDTSGLLLIAKKRAALRWLHDAMRDGQIDKQYTSLLAGRMRKGRVNVDAPLRKNTLRGGERMVRVDAEGKAAHTEFVVEARFARATLVTVNLGTGRTHQIRVHAQHLGHPVAGDGKYGDIEFNRFGQTMGLKRLFLVASRLRFRSPDGENFDFRCALEPGLESVLAELRRVQHP